MYEEDPITALLQTILNMLYLSLEMLGVHFCITSAGYLFADAEIFHAGNEQLLDGLEEGLVILKEDDCLTEIYHNRAAKKLSTHS